MKSKRFLPVKSLSHWAINAVLVKAFLLETLNAYIGRLQGP